MESAEEEEEGSVDDEDDMFLEDDLGVILLADAGYMCSSSGQYIKSVGTYM